MSYTIQETETVIGLCHGEKAWDVYTSIPRHVTKFRKLAKLHGAEVKEIHEGGIRVKLPLKAVSFRAPSTRKVSDEQKAAAALRFKEMWLKKKGVLPTEEELEEIDDEEDEETDE